MGDIIDFKSKQPKLPQPKPAHNIAKAMIDHITVSMEDGPRFTISEDELVALGLPSMEEFNKTMNDERLNDLHDATFDVQLMVEQSPEIAEYATKKIRELLTQLEIYKNNL